MAEIKEICKNCKYCKAINPIPNISIEIVGLEEGKWQKYVSFVVR